MWIVQVDAPQVSPVTRLLRCSVSSGSGIAPEHSRDDTNHSFFCGEGSISTVMRKPSVDRAEILQTREFHQSMKQRLSTSVHLRNLCMSEQGIFYLYQSAPSMANLDLPFLATLAALRSALGDRHLCSAQ